MSFRSTVLCDEALSKLPAAVSQWQKQSFSVELRDALDRSKGRRRSGAIPRMLRGDDVESVLTQTIESSQRQKWRGFLWLWYSGLFSEARSLLDSSPTLQHYFGVGRQYVPGLQRSGSRGHGDDPSSRVEESERDATYGLWGESVPARRLHRAVSRVAMDAQGSMRTLAVCVGGASGTEKDRVAKAIHSMTGRGPFAALGPEDEDPDLALRGALEGGTLYLRDCDHLQKSVQSALYSIMASGVQKDMLLIMDCPGSRTWGFFSGHRVGTADAFSGHLGRTISSLNFFYLPDLRSRTSDVPLLVNKALERLGTDDLLDIRHHLALWLSEQIARSRDMLDVGWVEKAVFDVYGATHRGWTPPIDPGPLCYCPPTEDPTKRPSSTTDTDEGGAFSHNSDFSSVSRGGQEYHLGSRAAEIMSFLHQASQTSHPWVTVERLETELNHDSRKKLRLRDAFSDGQTYKSLVESDRKGRYRLRG
jgi:hypothetical protein